MSSDRRSPRPPSKKLLDSKWTAVQPEEREKHFVVTRVLDAKRPRASGPSVELRCLLTKRFRIVTRADLENRERWLPGWL
jgi:tryptophan-rich hypothetical protein